MKYLPHIDGLRSLAVLPVIAYHLNPDFLPQGFLGVDVFFVISGYLITSIMYADMAAGSFSLKRFWARRVRRILPVVGTMVVATLLAFAAFGFPNSMVERAQAGLAASAMVSNIYIPLNYGSYWGSQAESSPFLHTWSLAVEEQFYLFYPLLLYVLYRYRPRWLPMIIAMGSLASFALFVALGMIKPTAAFYLFPARAWELGLGCFLAIATLKAPSAPAREGLTLLGLVAVLAPYLLPGQSSVSPISAAAVVIGAGLIIHWGNGSRIARLLLENRAMVGIGKLSYSLYIWHWPVIVLAHEVSEASGQNIGIPAQIVVILVLSLASYYLIETPIRRARVSLFVPLAFPVAGAALCLLIAVAWSSSRPLPAGYAPPRYAGPYYDISPVQPPENAQTLAKREGIEMRVRPQGEPPIYPGGGRLLDYGDAAKVMLIGDSHSLMLAPIVDEIAQRNGYTALISGMTSTAPFLDFTDPGKLRKSSRASLEQRLEIAKARRDAVTDWQPDLVILSARKPPDVAQLQVFAKFFEDRSVPLLFIAQPPVLDIGNNGAHQFLSYAMRFRDTPPSDPVLVRITPEHETTLDRLTQIVADCSVCHLFSLPSYLLADDSHARIADKNVILYYDDDHLSLDGVTMIAPALEAAMAKIIAQPLP